MKRLLVMAENTTVGTGYGTFGRAFIERLHARGDILVCEYSTYSSPEDDPGRPWAVLHNRPSRSDPDYQNYLANPANELGGYGFEKALLAFKPDVVWTFRDAWYDSFVEDSPLRRHFKHVAMPAIDAERQHPDWLSQMARADAVLTYTEWAANLLVKEGGNIIPVRGWAPPGADYSTFRRRPDRDQARAGLGLGPEHRVVGCFAPGTPVLMADRTVRPIEAVAVGDKVISHDGSCQPVEAVHTFPAAKPMVRVTVVGEPEPVTCTSDHEWLAVRRERVMIGRGSPGKLSLIMTPGDKRYTPARDARWTPEWVEAGKISHGDYLAFRIPDEVVDRDEVAEDGVTFRVDDDFLYLAGFYLANGSISSSADCPQHSIQLTINREHDANLARLTECAERCFSRVPRLERDVGPGVHRLSINRANAVRVWVKLFGCGAGQKRLPSWFHELPPVKQLQLVRGWQSGDGCDNGTRNIGVSINLNLLFGFRLALLRNGIVASLNKRNMDTTGLFPNAKQQWRLVEKTGGKRNGDQFVHNGYLYARARGVELFEGHGLGVVHDLTVTNSHSYAVLCKSVHNTNMRNQQRKLFPDLFEVFGRILRDGPDEVRNTSWLYVHAGFPDEAWHLPELAAEYGVSHRLLVTYRCGGCGKAHIGRFRDATTPCGCGQQARLCGPGNGVSREELVLIYNVMDVYAQVASNEGFGMPMVEAAACEVPVLAVDYSAMGDVVRKLGGTPVKVARTYVEPGLAMARRLSLPCLDDLTAKLTAALLQPEPLRRRAGAEARQRAMAHFDYDRSAAMVADTVLSLPPATPWDAPARPFGPEPTPPDLPDGPFARWCIQHVAGRPDLLTGATAARLDRHLFWGQTDQRMPYGRPQLLDECRKLRQHAEFWEGQRVASCV